MLEVSGLRRAFGNESILDGIDLAIQDGEFSVILGPSGCGKTTLLNVLAGFDSGADFEKLEIGGQKIMGPTPRIGVVFQDANLFPWYTIEQNIAFGHRVRMLSPQARAEKVAQYFAEFQLLGLEKKYPDQVSGGQRQRAAVARALINEPEVLLLDEPFRALDTKTRLDSQIFLHHEARRLSKSLCLVTHDVDEALLLGSRLVILTSKPTRIGGTFNVGLSPERDASVVISEAFHREKRRFVEYCGDMKLPVFPSR